MSGRKPMPCVHCGNSVNSETYVYFGVVGPFCGVDCREMYISAHYNVSPQLSPVPSRRAGPESVRKSHKK